MLSILSLLALLVLIITFGEILFQSRVVGRMGALVFFFSSSLSYLPFLRSQGSIINASNSIIHATDFLASGYPFRGETWGVLSANVFAYQRHLISAIGLFFIVMIFAVQRYLCAHETSKKKRPPVRMIPLSDQVVTAPSEQPPRSELSIEPDNEAHWSHVPSRDLLTWILCGVLLGLLPYWNSPGYVAALAVFGCFLILMPIRLGTACLLGAAVIVSLPQVLLLRSGNVLHYSLFTPGYTLENPTLWLVLKYLAWTFGVKWILLGVATVFAKDLQRRLLLALFSLVAIVFLFQLSVDIFNNHKLLNIWATCVNVYAAFALWQIAKQRFVGPVLAMVLTIATVLGGVIDLFPLHNDPMLAVPYQNDQLSQWLLANTKPSDVFLTHELLTHPILFTGRKIYLGYTLFAWTAGYNVPEREEQYRRMFQSADLNELMQLLHENHIAYVAIDDGVRHNETLPDLNEALFDQHFPKVFDDTTHVYDNVVIYKVP